MIIDSAKTGLKVVSIPQAVSTVATFNAFFIATSRTVSIPQAVSTVATISSGVFEIESDEFQYRKR